MEFDINIDIQNEVIRMITENNAKYIWVLILIGALTPYVQIAFSLFNVDPFFFGYFWLGYAITLIFIFTVLPLREYKIHQGPCAGKEFSLGPIVYLNHTSRDMLLGIEKEIEELRITWDDKKLKVMEKSKIFYRAKMTILKNESKEEKETRQMYKISEDIEKLAEGLEYDPSAPPAEQVAKLLAHVYNIKIDAYEESEESEGVNSESNTTLGSQEKSKKVPELEVIPEDLKEFTKNLDTLQKPEATEIARNKKGNKKLSTKPELIDLNTLGFTSEQQKKMLKSMYIYKIDLYHSECLEGYESIEFEQAFYILPGPIKEVLNTTEMEVFDYSNYLVKVQGCRVMWICLGFIQGKIPLLFLMSSENLLKFQNSEVIEASKLKNSAIYYLRMKIMEYIIDELIAEQDPFEKTINTLELRNEGLAKRLDWITQEYISDTFIKAPYSTQKELNKMTGELGELKKWKPIAIIFMIIAFILMFSIFFILIPLISGGGISEPPEKAMLIFFNYINLQRNLLKL